MIWAIILVEGRPQSEAAIRGDSGHNLGRQSVFARWAHRPGRGLPKAPDCVPAAAEEAEPAQPTHGPGARRALQAVSTTVRGDQGR